MLLEHCLHGLLQMAFFGLAGGRQCILRLAHLLTEAVAEVVESLGGNTQCVARVMEPLALLRGQQTQFGRGLFQ